MPDCLLREAMEADLTMFDQGRVIDRATFQNHHQYPAGVEYVMVEGLRALEKNRHLGVKPGRMLRKNAMP